MRRVLLAVLIATVVLLMAAPAGAGKPDKPGKPDEPGPDHPDGVTCAEFYGEEYDWDHFAEPVWTANGFRVTLTPEVNLTCIDLDVEAANWAVESTLVSALSYTFSVKDSVPGDFCYFSPRGDDTSVVVGPMPGASLDACGVEYSDSDSQLVFQALAKVKRGGSVTLNVILEAPPAG